MYIGSIVIQNIKYGSWVGQNGFHYYMTKFGTLSHVVIVMKGMFGVVSQVILLSFSTELSLFIMICSNV
jgi:hypothetical protein